jgi:hypothetical protein
MPSVVVIVYLFSEIEASQMKENVNSYDYGFEFRTFSASFFASISLSFVFLYKAVASGCSI